MTFLDLDVDLKHTVDLNLDGNMPESRDAAVRRAEPGEAQRLMDTLTLAFYPDAASRWLFPDDDQYLRYFPRFAQALGGAAIPRRTAWVADDHAGAALWLPPGAHPDDAALLALVEEGVAPRERSDALAVFEAMAQYHPAEPHWYLPMIGVKPLSRRLGLGGALLQAALAECDAAHLPAYLEATSPRNRALYARHGFGAVGEITAGGCPPITPMLRRPRG